MATLAGSAADAASGAMDARLAAVQRVLQEAKHTNISWHTILNNHATCCRGGFARLAAVQRVLQEAKHTNNEAAENVCLAVLARLFAGGLSNVVLCPEHWNVPIEVLHGFLRRIVDPSATTHQPLAVHQRGDVPGPTGRPTELIPANLERAAELVRVCLRSHGGSFNPQEINHKLIEQTAGPQKKVFAQLAELLPKGTFKNFVAQHPDFDIDDDGKRWCIKWRSPAHHDHAQVATGDAAPAAFALAASASAAAPAAFAPTARPSTNEVHRGQNMEHYSNIHRIQHLASGHPDLGLEEASSPEDWRNLPAYVFKGHVSSEGDLTPPPALSGTSSQESSSAASEQDETEAVEAQAAESDDSPAASGALPASDAWKSYAFKGKQEWLYVPFLCERGRLTAAASGAPSASTSCAPSFVRDFNGGDDREELSDLVEPPVRFDPASGG